MDQVAELEEVFPTMHLKLGGGVELKLGPLNYLFMHANEPGAYCLGVFDNGGAGTLLGGITFRNTLVQVRACSPCLGLVQAEFVGRKQRLHRPVLSQRRMRMSELLPTGSSRACSGTHAFQRQHAGLAYVYVISISESIVLMRPTQAC